jgi:hypothetical protein
VRAGVSNAAENMGLVGRKPGRVRLYAMIALGFLCACAVLALAVRMAFPPEDEPAVCTALGRAHIVTVFSAPGARVSCAGVRDVPLESGQVQGLLEVGDPGALIAMLRKAKAAGIAVQPGRLQKGLGKSLSAMAHVPGLSGIVFDSTLAVFAPAHEVTLGAREREALTYVARALLRGAREPSLSSFPPSLRRVERVEVLVVIAQAAGAPLLWRSARATSIPRALLTATRVARDRWHEREATMGGPLRERLQGLDVHVSLLLEDGTIVDTSQSFVDRAVTKEHGLGFDYRSDWHYLVPEDVQRRGRGSAYRALTELAKDSALGLTIFSGTAGGRLYRFLVEPVGSSPAPSSVH